MSANSIYYPLENAYPTYGKYQLPGPGVRPLEAPVANHVDVVYAEADEVDYPVEAAYRTSLPMYESQLGPYPPHPAPSLPPVQPVGVNSPPRGFREPYAVPQAPPHVGVAPAETAQAVRRRPPPEIVREEPGPPNNVLDYNKLQGLANEAVEKLERFRPQTLGAASRIEGVRPPDVALLAVHVERARRERASSGS